MKRAVCALFLICGPMLGFGQALSSGGIQLSGILSANFIDDFVSNTAYFDNNNGLTYLQLEAALKDGPFGLDSQIQFGPSGNAGSPTQAPTLLFHYGYGYANLFGGRLYLAVGRVVDVSTFGLNSFYQQGPNGPGVIGGLVGRTGSSGFGANGIQLKVSPLPDLVMGILLPYSSDPFPIVNSTLKATRFAVAYTFENAAEVTVGYQMHLVGVTDYVVNTGADPNNAPNKNKLYALVNVLVSDSLVAGARYELDHEVAQPGILSQNVYATLGAKIGNFAIGADAGVYIPVAGSAGLEALGAAWYTFPSVLASVDLQPYLQGGFFTSGYPLVTDLPGVSTPDGFIDNTYITVNPQLRLLMGKSQHELALGYSLSYDIDTAQLLQSQLTLMMQVYF